jgi:hypothetical protein
MHISVQHVMLKACFPGQFWYFQLAVIYNRTYGMRGTRWYIWFSHCATSREVADSILVGFTGIFHWNNPSGYTVALESSPPLTEMSTGNVSWGRKGGWSQGLATLPPSCMNCLEIWESEFPGNLKPPVPVSTPETSFQEMWGVYFKLAYFFYKVLHRQVNVRSALSVNSCLSLSA